ncbi:MAG: UDP-N-acetylmuramate:L-alanyl-gamma-D-glutamyl-meso-diaminopimelate ligase [Legionellales bacterium]|nr:UDP-N-acetylmuramate:L-alanyl-gamma-D-glutamyl-meso-diaminopimelate ligase [Legionellales bacterium]
MAGVAVLAKAAGYRVTGSDAAVYPPMSTQLQEQGIDLIEGFDPQYIPKDIDLVVIGNAMRRGNPSVEYVLNNGIPYQSGPEFLAESCLRKRWVLAVAGTHGKTTTASMLAWMLDYAGFAPGFLIGGVPGNFPVSAHEGRGEHFVIEADEYDSAFFDKRSKFLHYRPRTLITNNLEFDHADIFENLEAIKKQFHQLVRTVPGNGLIIVPSNESELADVLARGCWTPIEYFGDKGHWTATDIAPDGSRFLVSYCGMSISVVEWSLIGLHNVSNALAAIAAAHHAGVRPETAVEALCHFINTKRRMEVKGTVNQVTVYDDFAHHPTAIATTLNGLRNKIPKEDRIIAVLELGSYTMKAGVHKDTLLDSLRDADRIFLARPEEGASWGLDQLVAHSHHRAQVLNHADEIVAEIVKIAEPGDHIVVMSNKGFDGIHQKLLNRLKMLMIQT